MKFFCIADADSSLGFRFSGIEIREVVDVVGAREALRHAQAIPDIGIIIVTGKVSDMIGPEIDELTDTRDLPLVLDVPSRGSFGRKKGVGDFLRRSIGMSM